MGLAEILAQSISAGRNANRVDGTKASYRKDSPNEYVKVMAYLDGGPRPDAVMSMSLMGQHFVLEEDVRRALSPAPSDLPFREADLRPGFQTITVLPTATALGGLGSPVAGGNDVLLDFQNGIHPGAILIWGGAGQRIKGINCGTWDITSARTTGAYTRGGPRIRSADNVGPEHISLTDLVIKGSGLADAFVAAPVNANTLVTVQRVRIEYPGFDVTEGTNEHIDAVQIQGRLRRLEIGLSTIGMCGVKAPNDRGKGIMLNLAPQAPFEVALEKVNFRAANLLTGAAIFQAYTDISITLDEVWVEKIGPNGNVWSQGSGLFYPQNWTSSGTAPNRIARWPVGTNIAGEVKEGVPPGGDFCP